MRTKKPEEQRLMTLSTCFINKDTFALLQTIRTIIIIIIIRNIIQNIFKMKTGTSSSLNIAKAVVNNNKKKQTASKITNKTTKIHHHHHNKQRNKKKNFESLLSSSSSSSSSSSKVISPPWYNVFTKGDKEYNDYMANEWGYEQVSAKNLLFFLIMSTL